MTETQTMRAPAPPTDTYLPPGEESRPRKPRRRISRAAARGAIGAMAMTGMRQFTTALGLVKQTPPESIAEQTTSGRSHQGPSHRRAAAIELLHWLYGAGGGALYGVLPHRVRRRALAGPIYGVILWGVFEAGIAPAIGVAQRGSHDPAERLALLADHLLYGMVVGASPWPHRDH